MPADLPKSIRWVFWLLIGWAAFKTVTAGYYIAAKGLTAAAGVEAASILLLAVPALLAAFLVKRGWLIGLIAALIVALAQAGAAIGTTVLLGQLQPAYILQTGIAAALLIMLFHEDSRAHFFSR